MSEKIKDKALELIQNEINRKEFKSFDFLNYITTYLQNKDEEECKKFIKPIRKSIKYLEKHFDSEYLLFFESENDIKKFYEDTNWNFIDYADDLIYILNKKDYISEVDKITELKGKLELGYERYFGEKNELKVKKFSNENLDFELEMEFEKETEFVLKLREILVLKQKKNKNFKLKLDEVKKYLEFFPSEIYTKDNLKYLHLQKSLFPNEKFEIETIKVNNKEYYLRDLNNLECANLALKIISKNG